MTFTNYAVFQDENRHSCIFINEERKYTYFIPMEALEVRVRQLENRTFASDYTPLTSYPVRRAAEIFLRAPDKAVTPEAREHLEAILSDPTYAYDAAAYPALSILNHTPKGKSTMARKSAAQVAEEVAVAPKRTRKEALAEADAVVSAQAPHNVKAPKERPAAKAEPAPAAKKAGKPKAEAESAPRGRAPAISGDVRLKVGNRETVKRGFMLEFIDCAAGLEKGTRGKGFTVDTLLEAASGLPGAEGRDVGWIRTYVTYALDASRGILVTA